MAELGLFEKLNRRVLHWYHRLRVKLNPDPTPEQRREELVKVMNRAEKNRKKVVTGGVDAGWQITSGAIADDSGFGHTDFGELGGSRSAFGLGSQNPNALVIHDVPCLPGPHRTKD